MKTFKQLTTDLYNLNEAHPTGGKLDKIEYDLIEANKDRARGDNAISRAGKELKGYTIIECGPSSLTVVAKSGSSYQILSYSKSKNQKAEISLSSDEFKILKSV